MNREELDKPENKVWAGHIRKALYAFEPSLEDELGFKVGELIELGLTPEGGWWLGKVLGGSKSGWFPCNHVEPHPHQESSPPTPSTPISATSEDKSDIASGKFGFGTIISTTDISEQPSETTFVIVKHAYARQNEDELELIPGMKIEITQMPEGGWWCGRRVDATTTEEGGDDDEGWFPANHTDKIMNELEPMISSSSSPSSTKPSDQPTFKRQQSMTTLMQARRVELNESISKELLLRDGAEKLLKALTLDKRRTAKEAIEEVLVNLSFANAHLQELRTQLQALNGRIHANVRRSVYRQNSQATISADALDELRPVDSLPFIALGMKETKPLNMAPIFSEYVRIHFKQDPTQIEKGMIYLNSLRSMIELHERGQGCLQNHLEYVAVLNKIQKRVFIQGRHPSIHFTWYDSFHGQPCTQTNIALEKASVLFNAGAIATQLAAARNLRSIEDTDAARQDFEVAAGLFQYILDHFSNPPSPDISMPSLQMLVMLSLAQAQECIAITLIRKKRSANEKVPAGEPATVGEMYRKTFCLLESATLKEYVPPSWKALVSVKCDMYDAIADYYTGLEQLFEVRRNSRNAKAATWTGVARLCRAEASLARAIKKVRDELPQDVGMISALKQELKWVQKALESHNREQLFERLESTKELDDMLPTKAAPSIVCVPAEPDIDISVDDPFVELGSVTIWNAHNNFERPRQVEISPSDSGFGFTLIGDAPVRVHSVVHGGPAHLAGISDDDVIIAVNEIDARSLHHDQVVKLLKTLSPPCVLLLQKVIFEDLDHQLEDSQEPNSSSLSLHSGLNNAPRFTQSGGFGLTGRMKMSSSSTVPDVFGNPTQAFKNPMFFPSTE